MRLLLIMLLLSAGLYSQEGKLTIIVNGETVHFDLEKCYRRNRTIKTEQGLKFKVVVWNGYTRWVTDRYLILRSIGGKYSTQMTLNSIKDNVTINFDE